MRANKNSSHKEVKNQRKQRVMFKSETDLYQSLEKKSLIRKRLFPLIISLLILGAAVTIHLLVPLPSYRDTASVGNDTLSLNMTIVTTKSPT